MRRREFIRLFSSTATQLKLNAAIDAHLAPLLGDGKVSTNMTSNIAMART